MPPTNGEAMATWQRLLGRVQGAIPAIAGHFGEGALLSFDKESIQLGYQRGSFHQSMAQQHLDRFRDAVAEHLGPGVQVALRELSHQEAQDLAHRVASAAEDERRAERERERRLREQSRSHPVVQALVKEFGATVDHIELEKDAS